MRLADHRQLDALCGEYLLGTLRGAARRRFERALRDEPRVAQRLALLQASFAPRHSAAVEVAPPADGFARLQRALGLAPPRRWWQGAGAWRAWSLAATLLVVAAIAFVALRPAGDEFVRQVAQLQGTSDAALRVTARLSRDGRALQLAAAAPQRPGAQQSYELWLLPAEGGAPVSLAVLDALDARLALPAAQAARLQRGAKLAVSVEPRGGSPTGAPTGPVILVGAVDA